MYQIVSVSIYPLPGIMFLPQLLQSLQLLLLSEMVPSQTAGWRFHQCEWRWQQGQVQGNDQMEQHVSTLQHLTKVFGIGGRVHQLHQSSMPWLWYILWYTVIQIRSYCFLADSRRLWLCLFRLGLRTGTSRANNAYIASKNQSYFCSLHVQICARFTYFLQDILQGQCSTMYYIQYLEQIWLWLARALWPWVCGFLCRSLGTVTVR